MRRLVSAVLCVILALAAGGCTSKQAQQAATVASALRTTFVDNDGDGIDDNLEQKLAERFAPFILIEPDESNYPANVDWFLARASMQYHEDCFPSDTDDPVGPSPLMTQQNLIGAPWSESARCGQGDTGYGHPPHRTITTVAADPDGQESAGASSTGFSDQQTFVLPDLPSADRVGSTDPADWRTYFHAYPSSTGGVMIQYWHFFPYNALGGRDLGNHGGDWDAEVQVNLDQNLQVQDVTFSRHTDDHPGDVFRASQLTFTAQTHLIMTIDGGGHGAFASPQDFCSHRGADGLIGSGVWFGDPGNPINPGTLRDINCGITDTASLGSTNSGGIVWDTESNGFVARAGTLTNPLTGGQNGGPLVNLGEYNPCTPSACNNSRQASTLLAGQFKPLNNQIFLEYEGRWGTLPTGPIDDGPPRGPVFQGEQDNGSSAGVTYTAWYNNAASQPASGAADPWMAPPVTTASYANGTVTMTTVANPTAQSAQADGLASGALATYYHVYATGSTPPSGFVLYTGPFSVPTGQSVDYTAIDQLGNSSALRTLTT